MKLVVKGGNRLIGQINIGGAKNASLTLLPLCLLTDEDLVIENLPHVQDVKIMIHLLMSFGANIVFKEEGNKLSTLGKVISLNANNIHNVVAEYKLVSKMRASILVLGPLLARFGKAKVSLPGGCAIGARPINLHIDAFKKMGVKIDLEDGYLIAKTTKLKGTTINFPKISVGATENLLMLAVLAEGETIIQNAAIELEVISLCKCLKLMGANIEGVGSRTLCIKGVKKLHGAKIKVISDRIEAGTYAVASAITNGEIELLNVGLDSFTSIKKQFDEMGVLLQKSDKGVVVRRKKNIELKPINLTTSEYPGLPTDMQAQFMVLLSLVNGQSKIIESIFENRFMHIYELCRMGANITHKGNTAYVKGVKNLKGAKVMATDLRASVSLVLAGLVASGVTEISRLYHLDRGYEFLELKLNSCGAEITREFDNN